MTVSLKQVYKIMSQHMTPMVITKPTIDTRYTKTKMKGNQAQYQRKTKPQQKKQEVNRELQKKWKTGNKMALSMQLLLFGY